MSPRNDAARNCSYSVLTGVLIGLSIGLFPARSSAQDEAAADSNITHHTTRFFSNSGKPENGKALTFSTQSTAIGISTTAGKTVFLRTNDGEQFGHRDLIAHTLCYSQDLRSILMIGNQNAYVVSDSAAAAPVNIPAPLTGNVGISVEKKAGKTLITSLSANRSSTPQLQVGDEILSIGRDNHGNLKSILGSSLNDIAKLLAGPAGSRVEVQVLPKNKEDPITVSLIRFASGQPAAAIAVIDDALAFVPNNCRFDLLKASNGRLVCSIWPEDIRSAKCGVLSPDCRKFALAGSTQTKDLAIEVYDVATQQRDCLIPISESGCQGLCFTRDNKGLITLSYQRAVHLDLESRTAIAAFNHEGTVPLKANPEDFVVAGNQFRRVFNIHAFGGGFKWQVVKASDSNTQSAYRYLERVRTLTCVAVSAQGVVAIGTNQNEVHLLDLETGLHLMQLGKREDHDVQLLELSRNGRWLAYYSNGTLHTYDVGEKLASLRTGGKVDRIDSSSDASGFKVTSAVGNFDATFPVKPKLELNVPRYQAKNEQTGATYEVVWMEFGDQLIEWSKNPEKLQKVYDTFGESLAKQTKGKVTRESDIPVESRTERQTEISFTREGFDWITSVRLAAHGKRLYVTSVSYPIAQPVEPGQIETFVASFSPRQ